MLTSVWIGFARPCGCPMWPERSFYRKIQWSVLQCDHSRNSSKRICAVWPNKQNRSVLIHITKECWTWKMYGCDVSYLLCILCYRVYDLVELYTDEFASTMDNNDCSFGIEVNSNSRQDIDQLEWWFDDFLGQIVKANSVKEVQV